MVPVKGLGLGLGFGFRSMKLFSTRSSKLHFVSSVVLMLVVVVLLVWALSVLIMSDSKLGLDLGLGLRMPSSTWHLRHSRRVIGPRKIGTLLQFIQIIKI